MSSGGDRRFGGWRQLVVEALLGASAVALGFAAIDPTAEPILAAVVLVGVALLVELEVTAQPWRDIRPQSLRQSKESESARPEPQATAGFDAGIVDATSA